MGGYPVRAVTHRQVGRYAGGQMTAEPGLLVAGVLAGGRELGGHWRGRVSTGCVYRLYYPGYRCRVYRVRERRDPSSRRRQGRTDPKGGDGAEDKTEKKKGKDKKRKRQEKKEDGRKKKRKSRRLRKARKGRASHNHPDEAENGKYSNSTGRTRPPLAVSHATLTWSLPAGLLPPASGASSVRLPAPAALPPLVFSLFSAQATYLVPDDGHVCRLLEIETCTSSTCVCSKRDHVGNEREQGAAWDRCGHAFTDLGNGSCFSFLLPLSDTACTEPWFPDSPHEFHFTPGRGSDGRSSRLSVVFPPPPCLPYYLYLGRPT